MNNQLAQKTGKALLWKALQTVGSGGVSLIGTLILARLLFPDDFGLLAIGALTIGVLLSLTDFGMHPALVQRAEIDKSYYDAAWSVGIVRALVVSIVGVLTAPFVSELFGEPRAENIIRVLALGPMLTAAASIRIVDLTRSLEFRPLAIMNFSTAVAQTGVAIGLAGPLGVWALVIGSLAGAFIRMVLSYKFAPYRPRLSLDWSATGFLFQFGKWILLTGIIGMLGEVALKAAVARQLGTVDLGLYYLGARLALLPNALVGEALSQVAFPVHAKLQFDQEKAARMIRASLIGVWTVLMPGYAVLIVLTPDLVVEILGSRWIGTEPVIRILAVVGVIGAIFDATTPMLQGRGRPQYITGIFGMRAAVVIALAWVLVARYGPGGAALAWLISEFVVQIACLVATKRILPRPFSGIWLRVLGILVAAAGAALVTGLSVRVFTGPAGVVIAGLAGLATAPIVLWRLERWFNLGISRDLFDVFPQLELAMQRLAKTMAGRRSSAELDE